MVKSFFFKLSSLGLMGAATCGLGCSGGQPATEQLGQVRLELAACDSSSDQIRACVSVAGLLRVISGTQSCLPREKPLCWNQVGPHGSNSLAAVAELPADDAHCPTGGSMLSVGVDANDNGELETAEVSAVTYVCNGATGPAGPQGNPGQDGAAGPTGPQGNPGQDGSPCTVADNHDGTKTITCGDGTTVTVSDGAAGTSCTVTAGEDGSKLIDCGSTHAVVSDGEPGPAGPTGATSLIRITPEPAGSNCPNGGQKIEAGVDGDPANGALDSNEVTSTAYVCDALRTLVSAVPEPAGSHCAAGGEAFQTGLDRNNNGILEAEEIEHTSYTCNASTDPGPEPDPDRTPAEVLSWFGVRTDLGPRLGPDGNPLPADFHPLRRSPAIVGSLSEIYATGPGWGGVWDVDKSSTITGVYNDYLEYFGCGDDCGNVVGKGNIDGDPREEIVVASWVPVRQAIELHTVDYSSTGVYTTTRTVVATGVGRQFPALEGAQRTMSMAVGDFDDDGLDEVAFALFNTVYVFDDAQHGHAELARRPADIFEPSRVPSAVIKLDVGRFYPDGKQRLVEVAHRQNAQGDPNPGGGMTFQIFEDEKLIPKYFQYYPVTKEGQRLDEVTDVKTGDLDADGFDEILLSTREYAVTGVVTIPITVLRRTGVAAWELAGQVTKEPFGCVVTLDFDGDGLKEVTDGLRMYRYNPVSGDLELIQEQALFYYAGFCRAGDIDGDGRDEIVVISEMLDNVQIAEWTPEGPDPWSYRDEPWTDLTRLTLANLDDDGLLVEYAGGSELPPANPELRFTNPQILAVMAAPPTWQGFGQDGSTTYGKVAASTVEQGTSLGVSTSFTFGLDADISFPYVPIGLSLSLQRTVKESMNRTASEMSEIRTSHSFSSGAEKDAVVFTVVPFDAYYYTVVGGADPSLIGTTATVNLPRQPYILALDRDYYNANNGPLPDVDDAVLGHTVGNPFSYTVAKRDLHLQAARDQGLTRAPDANTPNSGGWMNPDMMSVGPGSTCQALSIEQTNSKCVGSEFERSEQLELSMAFGGGVGDSRENSTGISLTKTATRGFFVESSICSIPTDSYTPNKLYQAGLYAYPHKLVDKTATYPDQTFLVVNYWVTE